MTLYMLNMVMRLKLLLQISALHTLVYRVNQHKTLVLENHS